jgi:DNA-binding phage protein
MTSVASVALAVRAHGSDGRVLTDANTLARMRAAAAELGEAGRDMLAGPTGVVGEGTLVLQLVSPDVILPAALIIASSIRPAKTTFCAAADPARGVGSPEPGIAIDAALLASDAAAKEAVERLSETDVRESRFLVEAGSSGAIAGALLGLILEAYDAMTERQRQIVDLVRASDTQQQVARHLGVSRQAVNQSLSAAGWPHIDRAEIAVRDELRALWSASER